MLSASFRSFHERLDVGLIDKQTSAIRELYGWNVAIMNEAQGAAVTNAQLSGGFPDGEQNHAYTAMELWTEELI
jgi:hypothetical protein